MIRRVGLAIAVMVAAMWLPRTAQAARSAGHHAQGATSRQGVPIVGWYHSGGMFTHERMSTYAALGMKLIVSYYAPPADTAALLASAEQQGLRVLLEPDPSWMTTNNWSGLRRTVRAFRDNPALYGWYLADEPDLNGLSPRRLAHAYRIVKALDPHHPVAVVFTSGACRFGRDLDPGYLAGFDLLMFDDYPFYTFMKGRKASLSGLREYRASTRNCVASARLHHKLGPFMVLQGFGTGVKDGSYEWRDPTYTEENTMFRDAVQLGARGLLFYADGYADSTVSWNVQHILVRWHLSVVR